jgi:hypothetical protein
MKTKEPKDKVWSHKDTTELLIALQDSNLIIQRMIAEIPSNKIASRWVEQISINSNLINKMMGI